MIKYASGKIVEIRDPRKWRTPPAESREYSTEMSISGTAHADIVIDAAWKEGRGTRQVRIFLDVDTILGIADALRCCPNHINEDPRTGAKGPEFPIMWAGHGMWHYEHPESVRPCLDSHQKVIDQSDALAPIDVAAVEPKHFQGPGTSGHPVDCSCAACRNFDD